MKTHGWTVQVSLYIRDSRMTIWHLFIPIVMLLSAVTVDRATHWLWALIFFGVALLLFVGIKQISSNKGVLVELARRATSPPGINPVHATSMALFVLYLGSWVPDVDWLVHSHRNPLTHSALPLLIMVYVSKQFPLNNPEWSEALLAVFAFGQGSHLWTDIPPGGNVVWVPAKYDNTFLFLNGLLCLWFGYRLIKQDIKGSSASNPIPVQSDNTE